MAGVERRLGVELADHCAGAVPDKRALERADHREPDLDSAELAELRDLVGQVHWEGDVDRGVVWAGGETPSVAPTTAATTAARRAKDCG